MTALPPVRADLRDVLALYDAQMRRDPPVDRVDRLETNGSIVRVVGARGWISYSRLTEWEAPERVREEADRFRREGIEVEWKLHGHDPPPGLARILAANGFVADPPETVMVFDLRERLVLGTPVSGVEIRPVADRVGLETAVEVSGTAFAPHPGWDLDEYLPRLGTPSFTAFLALVDGRPVSAGRLELPEGRAFASLWGGGTVPEFRGRGVYRALVGARTDLARTRGYEYVTVDAQESSRTILARLGFRPLTTVVGWVLRP
ncbi:MAG: GNAT family N-acetyltransferase [Thermoplasmata archaeon]|nr:GNAT family N-acetyltransferase [Thermoplasmata archaeon]